MVRTDHLAKRWFRADPFIQISIAQDDLVISRGVDDGGSGTVLPAIRKLTETLVFRHSLRRKRQMQMPVRDLSILSE